MKTNQIIVRDIVPDLIRLMNKFNKLIKQPHDFGINDLLYPMEIHTIDTIGKNQGKTVTELCNLFGITKGAVSQVIGKLYCKGYVNKIRNKDFGKEKLLSLTSKGYSAFKAHTKFHNAMDKSILHKSGNISLRQIEQFKKVIEKIEVHIDMYTGI